MNDLDLDEQDANETRGAEQNWDISLGKELPFSETELHTEDNLTLTTSKITEIKKDHMTFLNLNVDSILARDGVKLIELRELVKEIEPEVITVTETWLNDSNCNEEVEIEGYQIIRRDRIGKRGGGVMIYIKQCYKVRELNLENPNLENSLETIWVEIQKIGGKNIVIGSCYRPPTARGFVEAIVDEIDLASDIGNPMILMGDMNFDLSKENNATSDYKKH